jgi:hypothetical protein
MPSRYKPSIADFSPSSADKEELPVTVSVWDAERTSVEQAQRFRGEEVLVLQINPERREALERDFAELSAVYVSVEPDRLSWPGAAGHAGLLGLHRTNPPYSGKPKKDVQQRIVTIQNALVQSCRVIARAVPTADGGVMVEHLPDKAPDPSP